MKEKLFLMSCGVALLMTYGCSKDNPLNPSGNCFGGQWAETYADELETWGNAAKAFSQDPTPANCTKYKSSAKAYLDALNEIYDCVPSTSRSGIDAQIKEAKAEIDQADCN